MRLYGEPPIGRGTFDHDREPRDAVATPIVHPSAGGFDETDPRMRRLHDRVVDRADLLRMGTGVRRGDPVQSERVTGGPRVGGGRTRHPSGDFARHAGGSSGVDPGSAGASDRGARQRDAAGERPGGWTTHRGSGSARRVHAGVDRPQGDGRGEDVRIRGHRRRGRGPLSPPGELLVLARSNERELRHAAGHRHVRPDLGPWRVVWELDGLVSSETGEFTRERSGGDLAEAAVREIADRLPLRPSR